MRDLFEKYSLAVDEDKLSKLRTFGRILTECNEVMNLTTVTGEKDMWIKHFLDSALGSPYFPFGADCCEIGSGGGFPSIPLKILRDDLSFTLIESTGKKCEYLKNTVKELGLKNVTVICGRAEDLGRDKNLREKFDCVTARAVARLNTLCEYCIPFIKKGGVFVCYKGDAEEEVKEAQNAVKTLGCVVKSVNKFSLPEDYGNRNIIVLEKVFSTPEKYPRGNGKERKKPL